MAAGRRTQTGRGEQVRLIMYTRRGCHLCEEMILDLDLAARRQPFEYDLVDIDSDPELVIKLREIGFAEEDEVELLGRGNGVGFQLHLFFQFFDVPSILAYTVTFVAIVQAIEVGLLGPWERHANRWRA